MQWIRTTLKIECISDLHGYVPSLKGADILIIAGDLTARDRYDEYDLFNKWINNETYEHILLIGGNHDNKLYIKGDSILHKKITYLFNDEVIINGTKFFGSPHSLLFDRINPRCKAFSLTEEGIKKKVEKWPDQVDILITHSPPYGILDTIAPDFKIHGGSKSILEYVEKVKPRFHIFGHIHEHAWHWEYSNKNTIFINSSYVNEHYEPIRNSFTFTI